MIKNYNDFIEALLNAGFSMAGGSDDGIYAVIKGGWNEQQPVGNPIKWHTGDPDTDPWEWRIRVLNQRDDIAYGKLFFKKSGYITRAWYPYFLAARRGGEDFEDAYARGVISHFAKRIYDVVHENEMLPLHGIKQMAGFTRNDKSGFDRALNELQMGMFLAMCGEQSRAGSKIGPGQSMGPNGSWPSTVFCTTEQFFGSDVFEEAARISKNDAIRAIREQVLSLNPAADEKKIARFIGG